MSVVSAEGRPLASSAQGKEKKHVVIYYPGGYDIEIGMRGILVCVPVDSLIQPPETPPFDSNIPCTEIEQMLPPLPEGGRLNLSMSCICTTTTSVRAGKRTSPGPGLYFFGGLDPPIACGWELSKEYVMEKVYRYDLQKLPAKEIGSVKRCKDMISGMSRPLLAQVGDDRIYVLGYGKTQFNDSLKPAFQEYNFKTNKWILLNDKLFDINKCDCDHKLVRDNLDRVPHVVIGEKLHVSLGNSSFTFDTAKHIWEDCKLFETFWTSKKLKKKKKSGRPSPLNFYGREVWYGAGYLAAAKKRKREASQFGGGPPFGFSGRGILWDKNILLGVHHGDNCPLVAFLLDDESGRVVKSQPISLDKLLDMEGLLLPYGAHLVDLGRDGHFGLVHFLGDLEEPDIWERTYRMELVIFKIKKIGAPGDDDHFLECKVVAKEFLVENLEDSTASYCSAFCV